MVHRDHALLIHKAVAVVGGEDRLRVLLDVSWPQLQSWLDARAAVPTTVFLKVVDLLERTPEPLEEALHAFLAPDYAPASREEICESALDAALRVTATDLGNVQLLDSDGVLRISAQRGFERPFLEFFAEVKGAESACGVALILGRQYSVSDVETHPVFSDTAALEVMLAAGARAVESSPIMSTAGVPLGMLSVHHRQPGTPDECVLALLARIARRAGALLEATAA
jgi:hypothetical protein